MLLLLNQVGDYRFTLFLESLYDIYTNAGPDNNAAPRPDFARELDNASYLYNVGVLDYRKSLRILIPIQNICFTSCYYRYHIREYA